MRKRAVGIIVNRVISFNQFTLSSLLSRTFYRLWNTTRGGLFHGDINGIPFSFYDPGSGLNYWRSFLTPQLYEHSVLVHLKNVSNMYDAPTFLDVGANYGFFTVYMSKLGGPRARVISFEPNSQYFRILSVNVRLNRLRNVSLHQNALSSKRGTAAVNGPETHTKILDSSMELVEAIPFDDFAELTGVRPDIVKIDVHGAEGNVLSGMRKTLRKHISAVYCELHRKMSDEFSANDVVNILQEAGMEVFELRDFRTPRGRMLPLNAGILDRPDERMIYAQK